MNDVTTVYCHFSVRSLSKLAYCSCSCVMLFMHDVGNSEGASLLCCACDSLRQQIPKEPDVVCHGSIAFPLRSAVFHLGNVNVAICE